MRSCLIGFVLVVLAIRPYVSAAGPEPTVVERFEKRVRPVLAARCWRCHGPEKHKGGLRLDSADGVATGGDSGLVVVAGKPEESRLIQAVRYAGDLKMPPKGRLNDAEAAELTEWVRTGAVWPESRTASATGSPASRTTRGWPHSGPSRPRATGPPAVQAVDWPCSPLDRFILAALERKGLVPASPAGKRTLIRRATFDLTGLPPTPEEVECVPRRRLSGGLCASRRPTARLTPLRRALGTALARPRALRRFQRHGRECRLCQCLPLPRLRHRRFQRRQALRPVRHGTDRRRPARPRPETIRSTTSGSPRPGSSCIGPKMLAEDDPVKMEMDIIDEQVDTVGRVFMGLTIGCARCHDHKFDPIPTADYYALAGIFKSTRTMENHKVVAMWNERPLAGRAGATFEVATSGEVTAQKQAIEGLRGRSQGSSPETVVTAPSIPKPAIPPKTVDELRRLREDLADFEKQAPPLARGDERRGAGDHEPPNPRFAAIT